MQDAQQALKVGQDPRMLPEYEALRAEINKLSHASRPDVDWQRIHQLASRIFEIHGVDLQTAIYFTLARARLQGLRGFTEGCEFLANLIVTQWDTFWPPRHQERARIEMLDWFIARISDVMRQYPISHEDKRLIYRSERALQLISEKLHTSGLSRVPRIENLLHFVEGYSHLFDETEIVIVSDEQISKVDDMQVPPMVFFSPDSASDGSVTVAPTLPHGSILVGREKGQVKPTVLKIETQRKPKPAWFWFACGALSCLLPALIAWIGYGQQEKKEAALALVQPVAVQPLALTYDDIRQARSTLGEQALQGMERSVLSRYQSQLTLAEQASPLYWYRYGDSLNQALQMLYPDSLAVKTMNQQWQDGLQKNLTNLPSLADYDAAREGVDALLERLQVLESQRKSVSISYLKTQLYEVQKSLLTEAPFAQRLNALEARLSAQEPISQADLSALESELKAFSVRLYQLQKSRSDS